MNKWTAVILFAIVAVVLVMLFFVLRPPPPPEEEEAGSQANVQDIEVAGDTMVPSNITLEEGDMANLIVSADHPIEFHVHGYDLAQEVGPDEPASISFEANLTGSFEVEDEETSTELGTLIVEPR